MSRKSTLGALAMTFVLVCLVFGASSAGAAPLSLLLPQSNAFAILGHSCGGIQESAYAAGFDATSGYPTGDVFLSTRCGGSGRGGGYHTTTYSAWAAVTWDFTAVVVSSAAVTGPVTVNPTLTAFDAYGNEVYNQSNRAYLLLASGFAPVARVTNLSPTSGPTAGGTTVTISGDGFSGTTGVEFGATPAASFTVTSGNSITAVSSAAGAGTVDVTVVNQGGASATSTADQFTFVPAPSVSSLSPSSGPLIGGTAVTITGTHFTGATRVTFGDTPVGFDVDSDSSITAYSPPGEAAEAVSVRVATVGGTSATTSASHFTYVDTSPIVKSLAPDGGSDAGGTTVTIAGTRLSGATEVDFGGIPAQFAVNNDTSITAVSPPAFAGTVDVTVTTAGGTSATSAGDLFAYSAAPPAVTGVSPNNGSENGGDLVTISGQNLSTAVEVDFGGVASSFWVNDDGSITAVSPSESPGTVDITVINSDGTSATGAGDQYTFVAAPTVTGLSSTGGPTVGGTAVTITGANLSAATEVDFGGVPAQFVVGSDTSITAVSPPSAAGSVDVTVTTPAGGTSATSAADQFTYT
jgi:hypothetical protein